MQIGFLFISLSPHWTDSNHMGAWDKQEDARLNVRQQDVRIWTDV